MLVETREVVPESLLLRYSSFPLHQDLHGPLNAALCAPTQATELLLRDYSGTASLTRFVANCGVKAPPVPMLSETASSW